MSGDYLSQKILTDAIFDGYCAGKRVVTEQYKKEKQRQRDNPED